MTAFWADYSPEHVGDLLELDAGNSWEQGVLVWLRQQRRRDLKQLALNLAPGVMETRRGIIQSKWDARCLARRTSTLAKVGSCDVSAKIRRL